MTAITNDPSRADQREWIGLPPVRAELRREVPAYQANPHPSSYVARDQRPDSRYAHLKEAGFPDDSSRHGPAFAADRHTVGPFARDHGNGVLRAPYDSIFSRPPHDENRRRAEEPYPYTRGNPSPSQSHSGPPDIPIPNTSPVSSSSERSGNVSAHPFYPSFPPTPTSALPAPAEGRSRHGSYGHVQYSPGSGSGPSPNNPAPPGGPGVSGTRDYSHAPHDRGDHGQHGWAPGGHSSSRERLPGIRSLLAPGGPPRREPTGRQLADSAPAARRQHGVFLPGGLQQSSTAPAPATAAGPATGWDHGSHLGWQIPPPAPAASPTPAAAPRPAPTWWQPQPPPGNTAPSASVSASGSISASSPASTPTAPSRAAAGPRPQGKKPGRKNFTPEQRAPMEAYCRRTHRGDNQIPLPNGEALEELMRATGLQATQITNFVSNFRRRTLKKLAPVWAQEANVDDRDADDDDAAGPRDKKKRRVRPRRGSSSGSLSSCSCSCSSSSSSGDSSIISTGFRRGIKQDRDLPGDVIGEGGKSACTGESEEREGNWDEEKVEGADREGNAWDGKRGGDEGGDGGGGDDRGRSHGHGGGAGGGGGGGGRGGSSSFMQVVLAR